MFATKEKTNLERKQRVHFPRGTLMTEKKKIKSSIPNNQ
jgi:hypothetical protein